MNVLELLEQQEMLQKLIDRGYGELVEKILMNEGKCFTKKGRCNKSGMCRILGWKPKMLEDAMLKCREILMSDRSVE
jgi:hypothetical protein